MGYYYYYYYYMKNKISYNNRNITGHTRDYRDNRKHVNYMLLTSNVSVYS